MRVGCSRGVLPFEIKEVVMLQGKNNVEKAANFLRTHGLPNEFGIFGLIGNLIEESGLNPKNLQNSYEKSLKQTDDSYTQGVDNGTYTNFVRDAAGYGIAQWTYWSRKQNMLNFHKSKGKSIGDLETQLEFLVKELKENYGSVWGTLLSAGSVKEASNAVLLQFERPKNQGVSVQEYRAKLGQEQYNLFAGKQPQQPESPKKELLPLDEIAAKVLKGQYGNYPERKQKLEAEGYNYSKVQKRVDELYKAQNNRKSNEEIADEIIHRKGGWGDNPQRKQKLIAAGYDYDAIQAIINCKMKK